MVLAIAAIVFIALVLAAANTTKRSLRELSSEEKAKLVDAAARTPVYWFLLFVALLAAWVLVIFRRPDLSTFANILGLVLVLALSATIGALTYRGYQRIGMPAPFLRSFLVARGLRLAGAAVLFAVMALWLLQSRAGG